MRINVYEQLKGVLWHSGDDEFACITNLGKPVSQFTVQKMEGPLYLNQEEA